MSDKKNADGLISARDLPPLKAWAFPQVAGAHVVRSPFKDQQAPAAAASSVSVPVSSGPLTVAEMDKLRAQARQQGHAEGLAEGRKLGRQQGVDAGQAEGHKAAYQKAEIEINDLKTRLKSLLEAMQRPLEQQLEGLEQALLRLVVDTAEAVTKQELATRPELLRQAVQESLDALPQQAQQLCFFVHADDEEVLRECRQQERADWEVVVDPTLSRGGIKVRGECSFLDYTVENRFSQVVQQVLTGAESAPAQGGADDVAG
ncbi:MAG: flagellar assembly protein FliH [Motiliproteus sp.]